MTRKTNRFIYWSLLVKRIQCKKNSISSLYFFRSRALFPSSCFFIGDKFREICILWLIAINNERSIVRSIWISRVPREGPTVGNKVFRRSYTFLHFVEAPSPPVFIFHVINYINIRFYFIYIYKYYIYIYKIQFI